MQHTAQAVWQLNHSPVAAVLCCCPNVLTCRSKLPDKQFFPPGKGKPSDIGRGGAVINLNMNVNCAKGDRPGDQEFRYLAELACVLFEEKQCDTLIVGLGVDSMAGDPLGGFALTADGVYSCLRRLRQLCDDRGAHMMVISEGGYLPANLRNGWHSALKAVLKLEHSVPPVSLTAMPDNAAFREAMQQTLQHNPLLQKLMPAAAQASLATSAAAAAATGAAEEVQVTPAVHRVQGAKQSRGDKSSDSTGTHDLLPDLSIGRLHCIEWHWACLLMSTQSQQSTIAASSRRTARSLQIRH